MQKYRNFKKHKMILVFTDTPLAPILLPFSFLIGVWKATSYNPIHFPFDFPGKLDHYEHTLSFSIPEVPMFNTPSLNYRLFGLQYTVR